MHCVGVYVCRFVNDAFVFGCAVIMIIVIISSTDCGMVCFSHSVSLEHALEKPCQFNCNHPKYICPSDFLRRWEPWGPQRCKIIMSGFRDLQDSF